MAGIPFAATAVPDPDGGARDGAAVRDGVGAGELARRPEAGQAASEPGVAVVLVTADWAGPARPAATVLRELSRRWGDAVHTVMVDASQDAALELLGVDVVPTWLRFVRVAGTALDGPLVPHETARSAATGAEGAVMSAGHAGVSTPDSAEGTAGAAEGTADSAEHLLLRDITATSVTGERTVLTGIWKLTIRRSGALPKHEVARDFGPDAADSGT